MNICISEIMKEKGNSQSKEYNIRIPEINLQKQQ